ncbi:MAG TPA: VOC family protein [Vicinamibacterales bacterium]|nr:VOC family protein [Vicinamibacterales bacterium]
MRYPARRLIELTCVVALCAVASGFSAGRVLPVTRVDAIGFTVSDLTRSLQFYTGVLPFVMVSDVEVTGRPYELLSGLFGARARIVRLALGDEQIELTEYQAPRGRPMPLDLRSNDRAFQHVAIIVGDMDKAYARLREHGVEHASTAPQRLPDWNLNAGGIKAFYFRDPDRHFLEILQFPAGKGRSRWHAGGGGLFLGIDHTAIVVKDTDASLAFYRDTLGLTVAGESENYDREQEYLNNVFGARLRITALRAPEGPGIELLEYLAPRDGRDAPADLRANDVAHWQTTLVAASLDPLLPLARAHKVALVSPGPIDIGETGIGFAAGALTRDPDGHGLRLVVK